MVEDSGFEPLTQPCKGRVFPISTNPPIFFLLTEYRDTISLCRSMLTPIPKGMSIYVLVGVVGIDPTSVPYQDTANPSQLNSLIVMNLLSTCHHNIDSIMWNLSAPPLMSIATLWVRHNSKGGRVP